MFHHPDYDLGGFGYDPRGARSTDLRFTDDFQRVILFDAKERAFQQGLEKAIPGAAPIVVSRSDGGGRAVIREVYADKPAAFLLYTAATGKISKISSSYRALDGQSLLRRVKYDYGASDGTRMPGYLTIPAGREAKNLPLIVLPHGGPEARDDMSFDWWSGFYAATRRIQDRANRLSSRSGLGDPPPRTPSFSPPNAQDNPPLSARALGWSREGMVYGVGNTILTHRTGNAAR